MSEESKKVSAGRVMILPRGEYDSGTAYRILDMVTYRHGSYVCRKASAGIDPHNGEYWQPLVDSMYVGGKDEWRALTPEEKGHYDVVILTDD